MTMTVEYFRVLKDWFGFCPPHHFKDVLCKHQRFPPLDQLDQVKSSRNYFKLTQKVFTVFKAFVHQLTHNVEDEVFGSDGWIEQTSCLSFLPSSKQLLSEMKV